MYSTQPTPAFPLAYGEYQATCPTCQNIQIYRKDLAISDSLKKRGEILTSCRQCRGAILLRLALPVEITAERYKRWE